MRLTIIDYIDYYGPVILFAITFYYLINKTPYLIVFIFGSIINSMVNKLIKKPRPNNEINVLEQYDFPSGHAQSAFFSLTFLALTNTSYTITYFMTFICLISLYERYIYKRHTIKQLIIGSIIGTIFSYILVYITQLYLYNNKNSILYI